MAKPPPSAPRSKSHERPAKQCKDGITSLVERRAPSDIFSLHPPKLRGPVGSANRNPGRSKSRTCRPLTSVTAREANPCRGGEAKSVTLMFYWTGTNSKVLFPSSPGSALTLRLSSGEPIDPRSAERLPFQPAVPGTAETMKTPYQCTARALRSTRARTGHLTCSLPPPPHARQAHRACQPRRSPPRHPQPHRTSYLYLHPRSSLLSLQADRDSSAAPRSQQAQDPSCPAPPPTRC